MPTRIVRDSYLDSERYLTTSDPACLLWHRMLSLADDLGCVSAAPLFLRRRCYGSPPSDKLIEKLLMELSDSDLIRLYEADGARYAFIPRFRQRLQRATLKHPMPPFSLLIGDDDAIDKFNKIKEESEKSAVAQQMANGGPTVAQPLIGSDVMGSDVMGRKAVGHAPNCPVDLIIDAYHELMPDNPRVKVRSKKRAGAIRARWEQASKLQCKPFGYSSQDDGVRAWRDFFTVCAESDFLTGKVPGRDGRPPFLATIDFLTSPDGFTKCIENRYHERASA